MAQNIRRSGRQAGAKARRPTGPVAWAQALLVLVGLAAFRAAQIRWQPEALATFVPGMVTRLLLRPIDLPLAALASQLHGLFALQAGAAVAIFVTTLGAALSGSPALGRRQAGRGAPQGARSPGRRPGGREEPWN